MDGFDLLRRLVEIPSPTGSERPLVDFLVEQARRDGFRAHRDPAGNFVAETGRGAHLLLFVGHVDTVEGHIPVRVEGETLWGRGSVDAKAALAAFYWAARDLHGDPNLTIRIVGAVDEEGDSYGAKGLDRSQRPAWIVVGEPSGADGLTLGYKGILRGRLRVQRPHHHGAHAMPSAADLLVAAWNDVAESFRFEEKFDAVQGRLLELGSHNDGLVDLATARFALRLPPGVSSEQGTRRLQDLATRHAIDLEVAERMEAAVVDKRSPLVAAYLGAMRGEGLSPRLKHKTGTADFNLLHEWFPDVPIVAYGPGDAALDHTPEERIARPEFERGVRVNRSVLGRLPAVLAPAPRKA